MKEFSNRYEPEKELTVFPGGRLLKAKDLSLQRTVLLYAVPMPEGKPNELQLSRIGRAAQEPAHPHFMQVLDVEVAQSNVYTALTYKTGTPFRTFIRDRSLSFEESADSIVRFGQALLEAAEERPLRFSLRPDNIWVTDDNSLVVINSWDEPAGGRRMSKELCGLLVRLLMQSDTPPEQSELLMAHLWRCLQHLPAGRKESAAATILEAWTGRSSLATFVQNLDHSLHGSSAAPRHVPMDERMKTEPETEAEAEPESVLETEREPKAAMEYDARSGLEPGPGNESVSERAANPKTGVRSAGARSFSVSGARTSRRLGSKLWKGAAAVVISLAAFVATFVLLIELTGNKKDEESLKGGFAETKPPAVAADSAKTQTETKPNTNAGVTDAAVTTAGSGKVVVPTLTGMAKEDAEKQAIASGLRYAYFLEPDTAPAGTVFKQDLKPNDQVEKGTRITFYVSKGAKP